MKRDESAHRLLAPKSEENGPLERTEHRWWIIIKESLEI
jgi:hypothetical protein